MFAPIFSLIFFVLGIGFFMSFISLHFKDLKMGDFQIGLAQSAFYLGMLISSLTSERLISRVGHIRTLTATCGSLSAITLLLYTIPEQQWVWMRLLAGMCVGAFYLGVESWLLAESPENKRGTALAIYTIALYSAQSFSQLFLAYTHDNFAFAFVFSALFISIAVIPVSVGKTNGPSIYVAEPTSLLHFIKLSPLGVFGCFISGVILSTLYTFMPVFFEERQLSPGYLMTLMIMGGALLQYPIGKLSDRIERRKILAATGVVGIFVCFFLSFISHIDIVHILVFFLGGVLFSIYPVAMSLGCDCVKPGEIVKMTGVLLFAYGAGAVCGPLLTPTLKIITTNYVMVMLCLYLMVLILIALYAMKTRKRIAAEDQLDFSVIPTGPLVNDLHPQTPGVDSSEEIKVDEKTGDSDI